MTLPVWEIIVIQPSNTEYFEKRYNVLAETEKEAIELLHRAGIAGEVKQAKKLQQILS